MYSIRHIINIKIYKKTNSLIGYLQISHQLFIMYRFKFLHRLQFNYHLVFDEQIQTVVTRQFLTIIHYRKRNLLFYLQPLFPQLAD